LARVLFLLKLPYKEGHMFKIFFCQAALAVSFNLAGQSIKTDYNVYPPPSPPALPAAGGTLTDPTFGTSILRVTDAADGTDNHQSYSYWPSLNKTSTLLYISSVGGSPTLYDFDTTNFAIANKRAMFASSPVGDGTPSAEDAIWSGTQPGVMFCHTAQKLYSYNTGTNQYTLLKDFSSLYPNLYLWQMSRSINDSVFAFTFKENVNYTNVGYFVFRASNNVADTGALAGLDEVQVDKTGTYLTVKTGNSGAGVIEVEAVNLLTGAVAYLTDNAPDFSPGHSDNGTGIVVGADNWNNAHTYRALSNPHSHYQVVSYGNDWTLGDHVSMLADNEAWVLISTYVSNTLPSGGIFADEIYQVATDGTQSVRRLCHTQSNYLAQSGGNAYWSSPRANISRNGKYVVFTSNWGSSTRTDVFVVKIPQAPQTTAIAGSAQNRFSIWPNPASDQVALGLPPALTGSDILVTDVFGRTLLQAAAAASLNVASLANGTYFVHCGGQVTKLVINR
jgi:hypothetical protein